MFYIKGMIGRSERIRTSDPLLPKQVRYQAALRSDLEDADKLITCLLQEGMTPRKADPSEKQRSDIVLFPRQKQADAGHDAGFRPGPAFQNGCIL